MISDDVNGDSEDDRGLLIVMIVMVTVRAISDGEDVNGDSEGDRGLMIVVMVMLSVVMMRVRVVGD